MDGIANPLAMLDRIYREHGAAAALAQNTSTRLQALEASGYLGHLTHIPDLFWQPLFRDLYRCGRFNPGAKRHLGRRRPKAHRYRPGRRRTRAAVPAQGAGGTP